MRSVFGDLHIHVGSAGGRPVKITASRKLDLRTILFSDAPRKGLDMVGIVDAGSTLVSAEIEEMLNNGELREHPQGGFVAKNGVLFIPGCEVESSEGVHIILYLPSFDSIRGYQKYIKSRVNNTQLSTQRAKAGVIDLINLSCLLEGIICPAHAFTPHKGIYGMLTDSLTSLLGKDIKQIKAIELGLSADSQMADMLRETRDFTFLSNSDAHSSANVGREYNLFRLADKSFAEFKLCLENKEGRRVIANYGVDPLLGKYHRSFCPECGMIAGDPPPVSECVHCGNSKGIVMGVYDRIVQIRDYEEAHHPIGRPPYHYRVPLKELPGVGNKTIEKMLKFYSSEIEIMERASTDDIERIVGKDTAVVIQKMRLGRLNIIPGGGGHYGKVKKDNCNI